MESLFSKRNKITFLIVAIVLVAIPFGVYLTQQQQTLKSKAEECPEICTGPAICRPDPDGGEDICDGPPGPPCHPDPSCPKPPSEEPSPPISPPSGSTVTTCKGETKTWDQLCSELQGAGFPGSCGPGNQAALEAYNRAACPGSAQVPGGTICESDPPGAVGVLSSTLREQVHWVADCNKFCPNNVWNGTDRGGCPANPATDFAVSRKDSTWCWGFDSSGTNRCLQLQPGRACTLEWFGNSTLSSSCVSCIANRRPDVEQHYRGPAGQVNCSTRRIINDWCTKVDPAGCNPIKSGQCANECGQPPPSTPPSTSQCFIVTETASQRNGLLNCSQSGAIPFTQNPTTRDFTLSADNGAKTLFVRFLKLSAGESIAACSDPNKCKDASFQITLNQQLSCSAIAPEGLDSDGTKTVGGILIPVFKTNNASGKNTPTKLNATTTPANTSISQPTVTKEPATIPDLSFVRQQGNTRDWFIDTIPANSSTALSNEYTVSGQCPTFIIRVPAAQVAGCVCSSVVTNQGTCSSACNPNFTKLTGITYEDPIQCALNPLIPNTIPDQSNKNSWCNRAKRTLGDADGNGSVDAIDYTFFLRTVLGGKIPPSVNPDFNGDGRVSPEDLTILQLGKGQ